MDHKTNMINLSRIAFEDLKMAKPTPRSSSQMVFIEGQEQPALCVSFAAVYEDGLGTARGLYPTKSLHAILHKQEYEYMVAHLCHLLNVPFIRSQVVDNHWAFSTRSGSAEEGQNNLEQSPLRFPGLHFIILLLIGSLMPNWSSSLFVNLYPQKISFDLRYCQSCKCNPGTGDGFL